MGSAVDYSYGRVGGGDHSHLDAVAAAGYAGILRYVSYDGWPKNLSKSEYDYAKSLGLAVGAVWETTASMMLRGAGGGQADSAEANRQLDRIGFVGDDVFYACDFQAAPSHYGVMSDYLANCTGRTPQIYGHYGVIEHFVGSLGQCLTGWQCCAWSGNGNGSGGSIQGRRLSAHAALFQRLGYVLSNTCDTNDILRPDWGQDNGGTTITTPKDIENPDVLPIIIPRNGSEDAVEIKRLLIDETTGDVFQTWGIFKRYVSTEEEAQRLAALGVVDARKDAAGNYLPGKALLDSLSLVP